ncbi:MAG TPA: tryptophan-rich sensory protein [Thermoleophilia bacterium]|nr:tryptophan-rich sensory protein [Thermoleophilia bacterium]
MYDRPRGAGWVTFSAVALFIGGVFAVIDGLMAVYRSTFFTANAVYVFSDLRTWGWIIFGLGVAAVLSALALLSGREWARWLGVGVAGLSAVGQLVFAQAYPLWSLMIMAVDFLVIYGLVVYGGRDYAAGESSGRYESTSSDFGSGSSSASRGGSSVTGEATSTGETSRDRRAA